MIASAVVILAVGLIAYMWSARGFLSAFLHMLCVIVAGAMALAVWEPLGSYLLTTGEGGFLTDNAWAIALAVPFILALVITRVALDKIVPANVHFSTPLNMLGGGVCGLVAGILTVGLALITVGYTRLGPDLGFGYRPVTFDNGSLRRTGKLIFPADSITSAFYSSLSNGAFRPIGGDSLAKWHPEWWEEGTLLRTNFDDGQARNAYGPNDFEVVGYYLYAPKNAGELFTDGFQKTAQKYAYLDGKSAADLNATEMMGVIVKFKAGAKEKSGRVVVGPAQIRLLVQTDPNDSSSIIPVQPAAMVSQADASKNALGRWRFDAKDTFIASVGGRDDAPMAFEFPAPKGAIPIAVYVKGARVDFPTEGTNEPGPKRLKTFSSQSERDDAIRSGGIFSGGGSVGKLDRSGAVTVKLDGNTTPDYLIRADASLPTGVVLAKDGLKDLTINDANAINGGELSKFDPKDMENRGVDLNLAVRKFATTDDTVIVQLIVDRTNTRFGLLSEAAAAADKNKGPLLIDNNGAPYSPAGFYYKDAKETWIYFNPQSPITTLSGSLMPTISLSKPEQHLTLIFRVSKGVKITSFAIGDKVIAEFKPALDTIH